MDIIEKQKKQVDTQARQQLPDAVIRVAGDSGDGMQLTGALLSLAAGLDGSDLSTFPDFPAEIRAPVGMTAGVSSFQVHFGSRRILEPGDDVNTLVAMNPAAFKVHLSSLRDNGLVIVDDSTFGDRNLAKAGYSDNPLLQPNDRVRVLRIDISRMTLEAVKPHGLAKKDSMRCRNMWALGLLLWVYDLPSAVVCDWLGVRFRSKEKVRDANIAALLAGYSFGETVELPQDHGSGYYVGPAENSPGLYRSVTGTDALAMGLVAGAELSGREMVFSGYPITPASGLLHAIAKMSGFSVRTFQAEDEIAAICTAIGVSYAGGIGVTSSSGPGIALKTEALGLAVAIELPLVVVNSQRGGPSTGLPTKTEQSDLFQAVHGRNADAPLAVIAACSPVDCFSSAIEAIDIATRFMIPVMLLTDGFLANASQIWCVPDVAAWPAIEARQHVESSGFHPFLRDAETLARVWAVPGTPGLRHRLGGIERDGKSGNISYDPANHQLMTELRAEKLNRIARYLPKQQITLGEDAGKVAVVGWGSSFGPIHRAVGELREQGVSVSHLHIRHMSPFPRGLGELLSRFEQIIVPEMNTGQLCQLLRAEYLVPARPVNKISGQPFRVSEIADAIHSAVQRAAS